ncbi:MAG: hypothetical protein E7242_02325 [Lachnospiraceae bacterium]|nr:hypothetical protein [Lachnospiraceae bacterium]
MENIQISCAVEVNGKIYFSAFNRNGLFKIDILNGKMKFVTSFIDEKPFKTYIHRTCVVYNNNIFFIPYNSCNMHVFNYVTGEQRVVRLLEDNQEQWKGLYETVQINNYLYLFSENLAPYLVLNMDDYTVVSCDLFYEWLSKHVPIESDKGIFRIAQVADRVYFAIRGASEVLSWDLIKEIGEAYDLKLKNIFGVENAINGLAITLKNKYDIFFWNFENVERIYSLDENCKTMRPFIRNICFDDCMLVIPAYKTFFLIVDKNHEITKLNYLERVDYNESLEFGKNGFVLMDDKLALFAIEKSVVLEIDFNELCINVQTIELQTSMEYSYWKMKSIEMVNGLEKGIIESDGLNLTDFICYQRLKDEK